MEEPFEECYFRHMTSQAAEKAIRFCGGNFAQCDIYKQRLNEEAQLV